MTLKSELGMRKGFENPAHEALLNIYYTASRARKKAGEFFRLNRLTDVQFNVLSLLRHQSGEIGGLTQVELSRMMLVNRANITTLIAAVIMFQYGTGPVRGFAVTLAIGIITSVFSAVVLTRFMLSVWLKKTRPKVIRL